jgi:hypothetical protein
MGANCCTTPHPSSSPHLTDPFSLLSTPPHPENVDRNAPSESTAQILINSVDIVKDAHRIIMTTGFKSNSDQFNDGRMAIGPYKYRASGSVYWGQFYLGKRQGYGI